MNEQVTDESTDSVTIPRQYFNRMQEELQMREYRKEYTTPKPTQQTEHSGHSSASSTDQSVPFVFVPPKQPESNQSQPSNEEESLVELPEVEEMKGFLATDNGEEDPFDVLSRSRSQDKDSEEDLLI